MESAKKAGIGFASYCRLEQQEELPFKKDDYIFVPNIAEAVKDKKSDIPAYVVGEGELKPFTLKLGEMTDDERDIILKGCLINYNRV